MATAALTGLDTWMSREWRERERLWRQEERTWRAEDMEFRQEERTHLGEKQVFRDLRCRWREEDINQRRVNNSRYLWARFSELNRRDVDEKAEHLRLLSWLTGLITSFSMTSPIEFTYNSSQISGARVTAYAICTALVPSLMTTATMICVFLLGSILKMGKLFVSEEAEEEFMAQCRVYAEACHEFPHPPPAPRRTFERFWEIRCEDHWNRAFRLFSWGITVFMALLCSMSFIKFYFSVYIGIAFTVICGCFYLVWLGTRFTWGAYLRKAAAATLSPLVVVSHRPRDALPFNSPFKWHIQPHKPFVGSNQTVLQESVSARSWF